MGHSEVRRNIELAVTEAAKKRRAEQNFINGITNQAFQQNKSNARLKFQQTTKTHNFNVQTQNSIARIGRANTFSHFSEISPSAPTIQDIDVKPFAPVRSKNLPGHSLSMKRVIEGQHRRRLATNPEESNASSSEGSFMGGQKGEKKKARVKRVRRITVE